MLPRASVLLAALLLVSCSDGLTSGDDGDPQEEVLDLADWTEATHGNAATPDYQEVFGDGEVRRIDLVIGAANWQTMLDDMTSRYGAFGSRGRPFQTGDVNPVWVPASVLYDGREWYKVGVRFKGNSSLTTAWGNSIWKLPFKLDFDEFEDEYPQIADQRFFGFKQLSLSSGFEDRSMMREKIVANIFREAGVPSAHASWFRLYVDQGQGPVYFGLYAMVEVVNDTVLDDQFADDSGNLYKPDGRGASFAAGTYNTAHFSKESNATAADWSDVRAVYDALHATNRTSAPAAWRGRLEQVFDTDGFLRWLAVNTVIQNWDTYGLMTHNYYLYGDPTSGRLTWIPWDNNEALSEGKMGGARSIALSEVTSDWPLIRFLMDDPAYRQKYVSLVESTVAGPFEPSRMTALYDQAANLLRPYVTGADGEIQGHTYLRSPGDFDTAISALKSHVVARRDVATAYVASVRSGG